MDYFNFPINMATSAIARASLIAQEAAGNAEQPPGEVDLFRSFFENPINLLMPAIILFFLIVVWPQQRQAKAAQMAHAKALATMKKNDRVITSGGIHGVIVQANADEPVITIRIDENTGARMVVNRDAIVKLMAES